MKKWQISKPQIVDWYLYFSNESYTTLNSVISSFKICFKNYGQLKTKFLRPKNTSSTFLKFELSRLGRPKLKTQKNTIRNQFEQQWFHVICFQKPRRFYTAIWYKLMPFAIKKSRFNLSTPAKCTSHVKLSKGGQSTNYIKKSKIQNVLRPWNQILVYKTMLWMSVVRTLAWCFHIMEISSIHTGEHTKQQRFKSKRRKIVNGKDCVSFHRATAYHCCHSFLRWKLRGVFIPSWLSWVILDQPFLESTTPDRW